MPRLGFATVAATVCGLALLPAAPAGAQTFTASIPANPIVISSYGAPSAHFEISITNNRSTTDAFIVEANTRPVGYPAGRTFAAICSPSPALVLAPGATGTMHLWLGDFTDGLPNGIGTGTYTWPVKVQSATDSSSVMVDATAQWTVPADAASGSVTGFVRDASTGQNLTGRARLADPVTPHLVAGLSSAVNAGSYNLNVPAGTYSLVIDVAGYQSKIIYPLTVIAGQLVTANASLTSVVVRSGSTTPSIGQTLTTVFETAIPPDVSSIRVLPGFGDRETDPHFVMAFNASAQELWRKAYPASVPRFEFQQPEWTAEDGDIDVTADGLLTAIASRNGTFIVTDSAGNTIWETTRTGDVNTRVPGVLGQGLIRATGVRFSPDGTTLAAGSLTGQVYLFTAATGAFRWRYETAGQIRAIAFSPDGTRVYVSSGDRTLYALKVSDGTLIWSAAGGFWSWDTIAITSNGQRLATGGKDGTLRSYRSDGTLEWSRDFPGFILGLGFSPDGQHLIVSTGVGIFDYAPDGSRRWFRGDVPVYRLFISATGRFFGAALGGIGDPAGVAGLRVYQMDGTPVWSYTVTDQTSHRQLAFTEDGARLLAADASGRVLAFSNFLTGTGPIVSASHSSLRFAATKAGAAGALTSVTAAQAVTVSFDRSAPAWTAATSDAWLQVTGGSGTGAGAFTVSVINPGNVIGGSTSLTGSIVVTGSTLANAPLTIPITLTIDQTGSATVAAIGQVDTPAQGASGVQGAIPVTGWAIDDVGLAGVKVYRNCLAFENQAACQIVSGRNVVFLADAQFVPGARPDLEAAFPTYPASHIAGWGMQVLSNMLPHVTNSQPYGGQGSLELLVFATDLEGHVTLLGRRQDDHTPTSITMNNDAIAKPFGAIDTPTQGGTVSGMFPNFGWVLTPDLNTTADGTDILMSLTGASMNLFIDGASRGPITYNHCRGTVGTPVPSGLHCNDDVANIFGQATPQPALTPRTANATRFRNLDAGRGPIGVFDINTSALTNGMHNIAWGVTDSAGRSEGIGSRNFFVLNSGADRREAMGQWGNEAMGQWGNVNGAMRQWGNAHQSPDCVIASLPHCLIAPWLSRTVRGRSGFSLETPFVEVVADAAGERHVRISDLGRIELQLGPGIATGYLYFGGANVANGTLRDLPVGSYLDPVTGTFTWAPAAGFLGEYRLVFVGQNDLVGGFPMAALRKTTDEVILPVTVTVRPMTPTPPGESEIRMHVDSPSSDAVVSGPLMSARLRQGFGVAATELRVAGWALDPHAFTGSGIGAVHVWARRVDVPTVGAEFVGAATLGVSRPDVAATFGAAHHAAGFTLAAKLAPGTYDLTVYVWNRGTARWEDARTVRVTVR